MKYLIGELDHITNKVVCVVRNGSKIERFNTAQDANSRLKELRTNDNNLRVIPAAMFKGDE